MIVPAALITLLTMGTEILTDAIGRVALGMDGRPEEAVGVDDLRLTPGQMP